MATDKAMARPVELKKARSLMVFFWSSSICAFQTNDPAIKFKIVIFITRFLTKSINIT
jgi:hypothetical protein